MLRFPRVFIYSKKDNLYISSLSIAGGRGTIDTAKSFHFFSLWKYVYLGLVKITWRHTTADWKFRRIHHVTATMNVKGGGMRV